MQEVHRQYPDHKTRQLSRSLHYPDSRTTLRRTPTRVALKIRAVQLPSFFDFYHLRNCITPRPPYTLSARIFPPNALKMAKETPTLSKDERKALKAAKKEAKASKPEGITKPEKKDKKDKKDKTVLAERALKEIQNGTTKADEGSEDEEEDGQVEEKKKTNGATTTVRPIGALVPFANPLADEKVAKKVFKGVKKGVFFPSHFVSQFPPGYDGSSLQSTSPPNLPIQPAYRAFC